MHQTMGDFLKWLCKKQGITHKELAEKSGVPYDTVENFLCNRSRVSEKALKKIAEALGTTLEYLYGYCYKQTNAKEESKSELAKNVIYLCEKQCINYTELVEKMGVSRKSLDGVLYGKGKSKEVLQKLADTLGTSTQYLEQNTYRPELKREIYLVSNMRILYLLNGTDQRELAEKIGVNSSTLHNFVTGRLSYRSKTLAKIAEAFGITKEELLYHDLSKGRPQRIGKNMRALRKQQKMPMYVLCKEIGVTIEVISKAEKTGELKQTKMLAKMAKVLGVTNEELLFGEA